MAGKAFCSSQKIQLPNTKEFINVPVTSAGSFVNAQKAMGISHCDPGLCLDLTRGLEIWVMLEYETLDDEKDIELSVDSWLKIIGGFGVGKFESNGEICLSDFAKQLLYLNLLPFKEKGRKIKLEVIFPEGQSLAERTSNAAFGVVDGLALIGTQAEVQTSASPDQLHQSLDELRNQCSSQTFEGALTFVIGENGLDLAIQSGLNLQPIIKTGNWLGPLIVAAAEERVSELLLFGYHGKLVKLAGGIFHTHHHLADGRLEVLTALAVKERIPFDLIKLLAQSASIESALLILEEQDPLAAKKLWLRLAREVEKRSHEYVKRYVSSSIKIGAILFDRKRQLRWAGPIGLKKVNALGVTLEVLS
ncbi:CbiD protein [Prochlorococcus marinus str. MIT 9211]|uniref:Cobalt-precorrin-5B C(1)-methyltransferase n=2 Tax=Prochlorococcus marinus TaxID=1219 RepID=A9B9J2_PROM4|nr:CbiD protein [Prochlorococcus marinus str. MIT 9211]